MSLSEKDPAYKTGIKEYLLTSMYDKLGLSSIHINKGIDFIRREIDLIEDREIIDLLEKYDSYKLTEEHYSEDSYIICDYKEKLNYYGWVGDTYLYRLIDKINIICWKKLYNDENYYIHLLFKGEAYDIVPDSEITLLEVLGNCVSYRLGFSELYELKYESLDVLLKTDCPKDDEVMVKLWAIDENLELEDIELDIIELEKLIMLRTKLSEYCYELYSLKEVVELYHYLFSFESNSWIQLHFYWAISLDRKRPHAGLLLEGYAFDLIKYNNGRFNTSQQCEQVFVSTETFLCNGVPEVEESICVYFLEYLVYMLRNESWYRYLGENTQDYVNWYSRLIDTHGLGGNKYCSDPDKNKVMIATCCSLVELERRGSISVRYSHIPKAKLYIEKLERMLYYLEYDGKTDLPEKLEPMRSLLDGSSLDIADREGLIASYKDSICMLKESLGI